MRLLRPGAEPAWLAALVEPLWYGHLAVAAFIVLSGFCLQLALFNRSGGRLVDLRGFLVRRSRRILPPYYACLALSLLVCFTVTRHQEGLPWAQYLPVTPDNTLAHVLLIHNFRPEWMYKINGVLWSISIEYQLYFLFPLIVAGLWRIGRIAVLTLASAVALGLLLLYSPALKLYVWYLPLFVLGAVAAHVAFGPRRWTPPAWLMLAGAALFLLLVSWAVDRTKLLPVRDALGGVMLALLLVAGAWAPKALLFRVLAWRPLVVLGTFSYSLYLMHHPIMQVLYAHRPAFAQGLPLEMAYLGLVGLPVILAGCYAFYWVFERPFVSSPASRRPAAVPAPQPVPGGGS